MTKITVEATYRCEHCQSEVFECDECGGYFIEAGEVVNSIVCYLEGYKHFCDNDCKNRFISKREKEKEKGLD